MNIYVLEVARYRTIEEVTSITVEALDENAARIQAAELYNEGEIDDLDWEITEDDVNTFNFEVVGVTTDGTL